MIRCCVQIGAAGKKNLLESGVLNIDFLERLWAPPRPEGLALTRASDPAKFQSLVSLLEKFEIAAALRGGASGIVEELLVWHISAQFPPF